MKIERAWLLIRIASLLLRGKAHTASRPWTCPAPSQRHWPAEPLSCRGWWLWSTLGSPGLSQLQGHTQSLIPRLYKKWSSSVGLAWWEPPFARAQLQSKISVSKQKDLALWLHLLYRLNAQIPAAKATAPSTVVPASSNSSGRGFLHDSCWTLLLFCFFLALIWILWTQSL